MVYVQGHNTDKTKYLPKGTYKEGSTIDAMRDATVRPDIPLPDGACIFCRRITASHRACRSCKEVDFVLNTPEHAEYLASIHDIVAVKQQSIREGHTDSITSGDFEQKLLLMEDSQYSHTIKKGCCTSHSELFAPYCKSCGLMLPKTKVCDYC